HEIRNLCSAALVIHKNLSHVEALRQNEDFKALSTVFQSLERVLALELQPSPLSSASAVELTSVFDEIRVLVDAPYGGSQIDIVWTLPEALPLVRAERYGLVQVFLNLAKNSQRAMLERPVKRLTVAAVEEGQTVAIRFEDTGGGVELPD